MRYLKIFENFEESGKLKAGMIIEDSYFTNKGTFVIQTNEGEFEITNEGEFEIANVVVEGDSNKGKIVSVDIQFSTITIELEGGKKIVIEDETGGEGLEIYEVEQIEEIEEEEEESEFHVSDELAECLPYLKKVQAEFNTQWGRTNIVHEWFDSQGIDYYNMSDLEMIIQYIESNMKK
jgi:hypothetical protein